MRGKFIILSYILALHAPSVFSENTVIKKTVTAPTDHETCFSPEEPCDLKLEKFIQKATHSIDVAIYSINLENIVETLIEKAKKIQVRVICDKLQAKGVKSKVLYLLENGVNIRYGTQKGIMHDKFVIVDNNMIETGSFNFTKHASTSNIENQVYLASSSIVHRFSDHFEQIWENSTEINSLELAHDIELNSER